jgi:hypothetical protein
MCGRYTVTKKETDQLTDRFSAVLNKREQVKAVSVATTSRRRRACRRW